MNGRYVLYACIICGISTVKKVHTLNDENGNPATAEIVITENGSQQKIEVKKSSNATAIVPESSAVIQQGNNIYIKPKFIIESPFTSYKQGSTAAGCCDNTAVTSNPSRDETSLVIGAPPDPRFPPVFIPPVFLPTIVEKEISVPPPRFPIEPQIPITFPSPCLPINYPIPDNAMNKPMRCPPYVPKFPTITEKPVIVPKPPVLPPINLPKFPIQVIIQKPLFPRLPSLIAIPDQSIILPSVCPPTIKCIPTKRKLPTGFDILAAVFQKFKKIFSSASRIDLSQFFVSDEEVLVSDAPPAMLPTLCAQGIIAERIIPNIVKNDDSETMTRAFPSQFILSDFNRK